MSEVQFNYPLAAEEPQRAEDISSAKQGALRSILEAGNFPDPKTLRIELTDDDHARVFADVQELGDHERVFTQLIGYASPKMWEDSHAG